MQAKHPNFSEEKFKAAVNESKEWTILAQSAWENFLTQTKVKTGKLSSLPLYKCSIEQISIDALSDKIHAFLLDPVSPYNGKLPDDKSFTKELANEQASYLLHTDEKKGTAARLPAKEDKVESLAKSLQGIRAPNIINQMAIGLIGTQNEKVRKKDALVNAKSNDAKLLSKEDAEATYSFVNENYPILLSSTQFVAQLVANKLNGNKRNITDVLNDTDTTKKFNAMAAQQHQQLAAFLKSPLASYAYRNPKTRDEYSDKFEWLEEASKTFGAKLNLAVSSPQMPSRSGALSQTAPNLRKEGSWIAPVLSRPSTESTITRTSRYKAEQSSPAATKSAVSPTPPKKAVPKCPLDINLEEVVKTSPEPATKPAELTHNDGRAAKLLEARQSGRNRSGALLKQDSSNVLTRGSGGVQKALDRGRSGNLNQDGNCRGK